MYSQMQIINNCIDIQKQINNNVFHGLCLQVLNLEGLDGNFFKAH